MNFQKLQETIYSLLKEDACPECGEEDAYIGLHDVECRNKSCKHFSQRQADEAPKKTKSRVKDLTWESVEQNNPDAWDEAYMFAGEWTVYDLFNNRDAKLSDFNVYMDEDGHLNMSSEKEGLETAHRIWINHKWQNPNELP